MTQTIKERLEELKRDEDACEDCEECDIYELCIRTRLNKAHNAGVDACLPLLEEVVREELEALMRVDIGSVDATRVAVHQRVVHQRLEALTRTK